MAKRVIARRRVSKIYQSLGAIAMAKGPRAVTQSPKYLVQPEKSDDEEEEPTQNSSVAHEEDDDSDDAEGDDELEEDEESEDQRGVGAEKGSTGGANVAQSGGNDGGSLGVMNLPTILPTTLPIITMVEVVEDPQPMQEECFKPDNCPMGQVTPSLSMTS